MGCGCFTVSKKSTLIHNKLFDKKNNSKKSLVFSINSWNVVLDFLTYKELNITAKLCRKFLYISRSPKILLKFFKNKEFLQKGSTIKMISTQQDFQDEKYLSPHFLSLRKSQLSNDTLKLVSPTANKELDESYKRMNYTNKTPSFKYNESSNRSINNTVSNINPPDTLIYTNNNDKGYNQEKDANEVFCKLNMESIKDENFKTPAIDKKNSNQIFYYDNIIKKNSYGTEFSKLNSSLHSGNFTWYESRTSSNHSILYNVKSHTINEKNSHNISLK